MAQQITPLAPALPATTAIQDPAARRFAQAVSDAIRTAQSTEAAVATLSKAAASFGGGAGTPPAIARWLLSSDLYVKLTRAIEAVDVAAQQAVVAEAVERANAVAAEAATRAQALLDEAAARTTAITAEQTARANAITTEATARTQALLDEAAARDAAIGVETTNRINAIQSEAAARATAIGNEQTARAAAIAAETSARTAAIKVEQDARIAALLDEAATRGTAISNEATLRQQGDDQLAGQITTLTATVGTNTGAIQTEATTRATEDSALSKRIDTLTTTATNNQTTLNAAITSEQTARVNADTALTNSVNALTATVNTDRTNASSLVTNEATARADGDAALAEQIEVVAATADAVRAATAALIVTEARARSDEDTALAQRITTLQASVDGNTAAIEDEATARADAVSAEASARDLLAAQVRGDYTGTDLAAVTTGLLYQERIARATADESLSQQITLLSAGAGEQFDYAKIWYFDSGVESWGGNGTPTAVAGWLRPADHATDPYVESAAGIGADGAKYSQVRLRVRKTGTPTWEGYLWWRGPSDATWDAARRVAISEPTYDANGIGLVTINPGWSGTIDRIRIDLSPAQAAGSQFELDWTAIGRPAPGASTAALLDEASARAAADSAEVTARQTLSSKLTGLTDPSGATLGGLSSGLLFEERQARATQDTALSTSITGLQSTVTGNYNTLNAAITSEATTRANADSSLSSQIGTVSATASGKNKVFFQSGTPTATTTNDLWVKTSENNRLYRWDGSAWVAADDTRIAQNAAAIVTEQEARAAADSAEVTARQTLATKLTGLSDPSDATLGSLASGLLFDERSARVSEDAALSNSITILQSTVTTNNNTLSASIASEATTRADADTSLSNQINTVSATASGKNKAFFQSATPTATATNDLWINTGDNNRMSRWNGSAWVAADDLRIAANAAAIVSEQTARADADTALSNSITALTSTVNTDRSNAQALVTSEATTRSTADTALGGRIDTLTATVNTDRTNAASAVTNEATARANADTAEATARQALSSKLTGLADPAGATLANLTSGLLYEERQARSAQDSAFATNLSTLSGTVTTNYSTVTGQIATEQTARADADTALSNSITALTATVNTDRTAAQALVSGEATTRASEDAALAESIDLVMATADAVRSATAALVVAETTVRASQDEAVATQLSALTATVGDNTAAITAEATARADADSALTTQINTVSAVANGRNRTFRQATAPVSGMLEGDVWYDADDGNKSYRYDGAAWVQTDDARIAANEAAITSEVTTRASNDAALMQAINTAWAITGATQAVSQEGANLSTNWTAAQANKWSQLEAEVFSAGGKTIRAALAEEATARANADGTLYAQWTVKLDVNGYVAGIGLASESNEAGETTSAFVLRADKFAMVMPGYGEHVPFAIGPSGMSFEGLTTWANVQGTGKPQDGATVGADSSNLAVGMGANLIPNSDLTLSVGQWKLGWDQSGAGGFAVGRDLAAPEWSPIGGHTIGISRSGAPTGVWDLVNDVNIPVIVGQRYEYSGRVAAHRCTAALFIVFYAANGAYVGEMAATPISATGGQNLANYAHQYIFPTAPAGSSYAKVMLRCYATGESNPYAWLTQPMLCVAGAGQTQPSAWSASNFAEQITAANVTTYMANAAIGAAQIGSVALVGKANFSAKSALSGARMEMDAEVIKVFDASGTLRVKLGNLDAA